MATRITGGSVTVTGGVNAGTPPPPPWYEADAIVAFDADNGALLAGHGMTLSNVAYSSTQKLPDTTQSFYFAGDAVNKQIDFTRTDANTSKLSDTDFTIKYNLYLDLQIFTSSTIGYPLILNNSLKFYHQITTQTNDDARFTIWDDTNGTQFTGINRSDFTANQWMEIKITYNSTSNVHTMYVDDTQIGTVTNEISSYTITEEFLRMQHHPAYMDQYQIVPRIF